MRRASPSTRYADLDSVGLLDLVRSGDNDAYGELFTRYESFAHRVARRASRRHADDLVAESFRRVLTAIGRGAGPTQAFGPYLAVTIRSVAAGLAAPFQEVEFDVAADVTEEHGDVDPRVSTAYLSLPESWQNALWYSDVEGLSPRQAAPLLGLPSSNAFSALRQRARAGLRSAYLTQVVDDVCNDQVRRHLELLMAGDATPEAVDAVVDEHMASCDECSAIAWRVAAVTGSKLPVALAPALLAFHGFVAGPAMFPPGFGMTGLLGWWKRQSQPGAAVAATSVAVCGALVLAGVIVAGNRGEPTPLVSVPSVATTPDTTEPVVPEPTAPPSTTTTSTTTTSTTTTTTTTSTTTTSTTTTSVPGPVIPPPTTASASTTTTSTTTTSTTTTTTSTTLPPTTTTSTTTTPTTTTTLPAPPPGDLVIQGDTVAGLTRGVWLRVEALTGAPGTVEFSAPIDPILIENATCGTRSCTFAGVLPPAVVRLSVLVDPAPVTIQLLDAGGLVVDTYTSP